jgi:dihydropteroate synthase
MAPHNSHFIQIATLKAAQTAIKAIGSDPQSVDIMAPKAVTKVIKIEQVIMQDAIIMKQDMLSVGGEVALPKDAFTLHTKTADILVIGTIKQHTDFIAKLMRHYPRLQTIAQEIATLIKTVD